MAVALHPPAVVSPAPPAVSINLESAAVPDLVRALCLATEHSRYALSPAIAGDGEKLTLQVSGSPSDVWADGLAALQLAGVEAVCVRGMCRFRIAEAPKPVEKHDPPPVVFSYAPKFRDVSFLASQLNGMFPGWKFAGGSNGAAAAASSSVSSSIGVASSSGSTASAGASGGARATESVATQLVGLGPVSERQKVAQVLEELDRPVVPIVVRMAVYEVDVSDSQQSAINAVGAILKTSASVGASTATSLYTGGLVGLNLKIGGFSAVVAALDSNSSAHLVTAPVLRTSSGVMASAAVGDSVPTLGSVSYAGQSSTPVQSVDYQQSGVVFSVLPTVIGDRIDVALYQSISSFSATSVGVTSSPTLSNRALSSDIIVQPGQTVVLGGLMQENTTKGSAGWWFAPKLSRSDTHTRDQLVLVMSAELAQ